ncbi:MAG TPA: hypothetical protein IGS52_13610 [Oscillatoriaceae cyanobacterium M33_DOE_052]|uniref:Uncharacterized protein n=1 Tax=Planktothricoides sp. SpSt-374 TaxID=2282167 RepID=A0A7C3ZG10_9CYAN|nr:hypothetical protein [Oscillatoriaceae cyanobacterium M33_DOE_052]
MAIFREFIAPLLILLVFLVALVAVSARIWLPQEMMGPAPIEEPVEDLSFVQSPLSNVPCHWEQVRCPLSAVAG